MNRAEIYWAESSSAELETSRAEAKIQKIPKQTNFDYELNIHKPLGVPILVPVQYCLEALRSNKSSLNIHTVFN